MGKTYFVTNTIQLVQPKSLSNPTLSDSEDSSDEESNPEAFLAPFPAIKISDERGNILRQPVTPSDTDKSPEGSSCRDFLNILRNTGFFPPESAGVTNPTNAARKYANKHLRSVVCLNRPYSPSKRQNNMLNEALTSANNGIRQDLPAFNASAIAVFWEPKYEWCKKSTGRPNPEITVDLVRRYYKFLKRTNRNQALQFLIDSTHIENSMVPYRGLREYCKNHPQTLQYIREFKTEHPGKGDNIYLYFCDADTISFCVPTQPGALYAFTKHCNSQVIPPGVISGGYLYHSDTVPSLSCASEVDMVVRHATACYLPFSVYYPDPSCAVKVSGDCVPESFETDNRNYKSSNEVMVLINAIRKNRKNVTAVFLPTGKILTPAPKRAHDNKRGSALKLSPLLKLNNNKLRDWCHADIKTLFNCIAQSHANARDWAVNVLNGIPLKKKVSLFDHDITDGRVIRGLAISIVSRLFNYFSPLTMSVFNKTDNQSLEETLLYVCDHYHMKLTRLVPPQASNRCDKLWLQVDNIKTKRGLLDTLNALFESEQASKQINNAAKYTGKDIAQYLAQHLDRSAII